MQKIWETEWFNIRFKSFTKLSEEKIAGMDFYKLFYNEFYKKYSRYEDLPKDWIESKKNIAKDIHLHSCKERKLLSIGCGIGFVEHELHELRRKVRDTGEVVAIDPNLTAKFLHKGVNFKQGYFPQIVENESFDFVYSSVIDYSFTDDKYVDFLKDIYNFRVKRFMLVNCLPSQNNWTFLNHLKEVVKELLSLLHVRSRGQFWGYLRSIDEQIILLKKAGFQEFEVGEHKNGNSFWIIAKP
jgi:SAM-dependent methyltransferase